MPNFVRSQVNIEVAPDGAIIHDPTVSNAGNYFSFIVEALVPFPAEGYTFPEATDSLTCCITWDRPVAPGKYAFGIRAYSYRRSDGSFFGTTTRLMTIDVDSSMIISGLELWQEELFDVFPNPASEVLYVQFQTFPGPQASVHIYDVMGRKVYSGKWKEAMPGGRLEVPVAGWAPGVYVVEVRLGGRVSVRKFVVGAE
ncbi:MAG: T9SS type A sorting domain-containing protein [Lewinellaceae bacterium]|nr:T9SS type A sorting domain-containing protein [Lewinellaceae bacterium]MCB9289085.1 T9SS type A sorting domain-containing protein [Lewinellaceae bacterium]